MSERKRFWGARLNDGVEGKHLLTFYFAAFFTIMLAVAVSALQPYLLQQFLGLPISENGNASGKIGFISEIALLALLYGLVFFALDPTSVLMKVAAAVIGFGQVGGVISSQVLIQQQAPTKFRGSVVGAFGTCGAARIMVALILGGKLFDGWRGAGPFVLLAVLNVLVIALAFAFAVKARVKAKALGDAGVVAMVH